MAKKEKEKKKGKSKKAATLKINFKGVETSNLIPEASYLITPTDIEKAKSQGEGNDYLSWTFIIVDGKFKGQKLYHNTSLQPQALWNLKGVLEAFGIEVPDGAMDLNPANICDPENTAGCEVYHDTYDGKKRSKIGDIFPAEALGEDNEDDDDDDDDDDEEDSDSTESGDDDDDEVTKEDIEGMTKDELEEFIDENELDKKFKKIKSLKKKRAAVIEALFDGDDDDEDDDDDDDSDDSDDDSEDSDDDDDDDEDSDNPSKEDINIMTKDELKEVTEEYELKGINKKDPVNKFRKAVIKAMKKAGSLAE